MTTGLRPARRTWRVRLRRDRSLVLMALPAVVLLLVFNYVPLFGLVTAFQEYDPLSGVSGSAWVGFHQFERLFGDPLFWGAVRNTLYLSFVQLVLFFPVPIALALLLNSVLSERIRNFIQSVVYLPHFFSWVLAITIFQQMLGGAGVLNQFLRSHDLGTWDVMTNPDTFALLVTSQVIWKEAGWGSSSSWPRSPPSTPTSTRRPRRTAPGGGGGCGTSRCPACAV